ncbi:hypothetical protein FUAX_35210 [Fulvitalea axinellae]|uniref:Uncharacterized protein n=1 Tax=Fulvitalea axinellae TaxID=1182444 RepID=A0AAU9D942_9BACT|nr:hypothetical protein FUAX_35210 [Fulvitalea axinellae]
MFTNKRDHSDKPKQNGAGKNGASRMPVSAPNEPPVQCLMTPQEFLQSTRVSFRNSGHPQLPRIERLLHDYHALLRSQNIETLTHRWKEAKREYEQWKANQKDLSPETSTMAERLLDLGYDFVEETIPPDVLMAGGVGGLEGSGDSSGEEVNTEHPHTKPPANEAARERMLMEKRATDVQDTFTPVTAYYTLAFQILYEIRMLAYRWHREHPVSFSKRESSEARLLKSVGILLDDVEQEHQTLIRDIVRSGVPVWIPEFTRYQEYFENIGVKGEQFYDVRVEDVNFLWTCLTSDELPFKINGHSPGAIIRQSAEAEGLPSPELKLAMHAMSMMAHLTRSGEGRQLLRPLVGLDFYGARTKDIERAGGATIAVSPKKPSSDKRYELSYSKMNMHPEMRGVVKAHPEDKLEGTYGDVALSYPVGLSHCDYLGEKLVKGERPGQSDWLTMYPPHLHFANALATSTSAWRGLFFPGAQFTSLGGTENPLRGEEALPRRVSSGLTVWGRNSLIPRTMSRGARGELITPGVETRLDPPKAPATLTPLERFRHAAEKITWREALMKDILSSADDQGRFSTMYSSVVMYMLSQERAAHAMAGLEEAAELMAGDEREKLAFIQKNKQAILKKYWLDLLSESREKYGDTVEEEEEEPYDPKATFTKTDKDEYLIDGELIKTEHPRTIHRIRKLQRALRTVDPEMVDKLGGSLAKTDDTFKLIGEEVQEIDEAINAETLSSSISEITGSVTSIVDTLTNGLAFIKGSVTQIKELIDTEAEHDLETIVEHGFERAKELAKSSKGVIELTRNVMSIAGKATPAVSSAVPILGIVVSAIEIARRSFILAKDIRNYLVMRRRKKWLIEQHGSDPLLDRLLSDEGELNDGVLYLVTYREDFREKLLKEKLHLKPEAIEAEHWEHAREIDLADELMDVNRDRIISECVHLTADTIRIVGNIVILTGVSAPAGLGLNIAASGIEGGMYIVRYGVQKIRDLGWGSPDETTKGRHNHRLDLIKELFFLISEYNGKSETRALIIESYIRAMGASPSELVMKKTNKERVQALYKSLKDLG